MTDHRTVNEKIYDGVYNDTIMPPSEILFEKYYVYSKGKIVENGISHELVTRDMRDEWQYKGYLVETVIDTKRYKAARKVHARDQFTKRNQLRVDLAEEHEVTGNPKEGLLFNIASALSGDKLDIAHYYECMVDLIKPDII